MGWAEAAFSFQKYCLFGYSTTVILILNILDLLFLIWHTKDSREFFYKGTSRGFLEYKNTWQLIRLKMQCYKGLVLKFWMGLIFMKADWWELKKICRSTHSSAAVKSCLAKSSSVPICTPYGTESNRCSSYWGVWLYSTISPIIFSQFLA